MTKPTPAAAGDPVIVSGDGFRLRGTASADAGVARVQYKLPGGVIRDAVLKPNGQWKAVVGSVPAFQQFMMTLRAVDALGHASGKLKL